MVKHNEDDTNRLFDLFAGEYVRFLLNKDMKQSIEHGGAIKVVQAPLNAEGYLIDVDDEFYYLGLDPQVISKAVNKNQIIQIELADPNEEAIDLLDETVEIPKSKSDKGFN